jgi:glycosyltransferase involved in cell wall biosynthesis
MKIAALLHVKDECELIRHSISHLRAIGVDRVVVCDFESKDGTREILASYPQDESFQVIDHRDSETEEIGGWNESYNVTTLITRQIAQAGFDWLMYLDADEFWIPRTGSIRDCAELTEADVVRVDRFNVPLMSDPMEVAPLVAREHAFELPLIVKSFPDFRDQLKTDPALPWIRFVPGPKVMVRPQLVGSVEIGDHDVNGLPGAELRKVNANGLVIAHFPFTSRARFARKVANIQRIISPSDLGGDVAWHWRRWVGLAGAGQIDREYEQTAFDAGTLAALRAEGFVRTAGEFMGIDTAESESRRP